MLQRVLKRRVLSMYIFFCKFVLVSLRTCVLIFLHSLVTESEWYSLVLCLHYLAYILMPLLFLSFLLSFLYVLCQTVAYYALYFVWFSSSILHSIDSVHSLQSMHKTFSMFNLMTPTFRPYMHSFMLYCTDVRTAEQDLVLRIILIAFRVF